MAKAKLWKIGSRVEIYIDDFFHSMDTYDLEVGSVFTVQKHKKTSDIIFNFDAKNGSIEIMDNTKASQTLKTFLTFNIIDPVGIESFEKDSELFDSVEYEIKSNANNWRENFVEYLESVNYLDESENDPEMVDDTEWLFKNQKNAIYSFLKTFEVFNYEEINDYNEDERKVFNYWMFSTFFVDFKEELELLSSKIIHPLAGVVRKRKDLDNIEWKDFKINNLNEVKDGQIESQLWNLADIISSGKNISIPIMQRKYVWDTSLVDKLMDDIFDIGNNKPFHYIGSIVYKEKGNNLRILDGQQRLTTMFLVFAALYEFFISEEASYNEIKVPKYFQDIFPRGKESTSKALSKRFQHVYGNKDFDEFSHILRFVEAPKKVDRGNMTTNFLYAGGKIKLKFDSIANQEDKQNFLEDITLNLIERVAFTVNKNQIEDEYSIFEKLNTLSEPLNQIDLMKNHILPYCKSDELDNNENPIQTEFYKQISSKFEKNNNITEASVKRFVNYFLQLYSQKFITAKEEIDLKPFEKLSIILERKYDLDRDSKSFEEFLDLLKAIGSEIDSFQSITERKNYINPENIYYNFSDLLSSFEQRYVYAPLIKQIFDIYEVESLKISKVEEKVKINKVRKLLFEIERYELLLQVVLYRGQSISGILEKVSNKIREVLSTQDEISPKELRDIFSDDAVMSSTLISPTLDTFTRKVENEAMADKVSILILNRIKFWYNNNSTIELATTMTNNYRIKPTREHIMSQKILDDNLRKDIYSNSKEIATETYSDEEFNRLHKSYLDMIGNIMIVESSDNSKFNNKSPMDKLADYNTIPYLESDPVFIGANTGKKGNPLSLKAFLSNKQLGFDEIRNRSIAIAEILLDIYA